MPGGIHPQLNRADRLCDLCSTDAAGTWQSKCATQDACIALMQMQLFQDASFKSWHRFFFNRARRAFQNGAVNTDFAGIKIKRLAT